MAKTSIFIHFIFFTFLSILFKSLSADPTSSFFYKGFSKVSNFHSNLALFGNAKVLNGTSSLIQLTASAANSSAGRVMYKKPVKLVEGKPKKLLSFLTYFSFSISPQNGNGLAFVMVPKGISLQVFDNSSFGLPFEVNNSASRVFAIEFYTYKDSNLNENHVGIDIGSFVSVRISTLSSINLVRNNGNRLHCWIEYEAYSKVLEIRLSEFGYKRPSDPLLTYPVDFLKLWKDEEEVFVGLSSSNGNSNQTCNLLSWSFKLRHAFSWMHSEPLDPKIYVEKPEPLRVEKRSACVLRVISALIFGTGCGALGALIALIVWNICGKKCPVAPEKLATGHPVDFDYKKIEVASDKAIKDGKI